MPAAGGATSGGSWLKAMGASTAPKKTSAPIQRPSTRYTREWKSVRIWLHGSPAGEPLYTAGHRRMGGKEISKARTADKGRDDKQVRGRSRSLHGQAFGVGIELLQCAGQGVRISCDMRPGGIGFVFPGPGDGQLNKGRSDGGENKHEQTAAIHTAPAIAVAA